MTGAREAIEAFDTSKTGHKPTAQEKIWMFDPQASQAVPTSGVYPPLNAAMQQQQLNRLHQRSKSSSSHTRVAPTSPQPLGAVRPNGTKLENPEAQEIMRREVYGPHDALDLLYKAATDSRPFQGTSYSGPPSSVYSPNPSDQMKRGTLQNDHGENGERRRPRRAAAPVDGSLESSRNSRSTGHWDPVALDKRGFELKTHFSESELASLAPTLGRKTGVRMPIPLLEGQSRLSHEPQSAEVSEYVRVPDPQDDFHMIRRTVHRAPGHLDAAYDHEAATRHGTEVHSQRTNKVCISYTISEDLSGGRENQILSRISEKKRDSGEVRLRIGSSYADSTGAGRKRRREEDDEVGGRKALRDPKQPRRYPTPPDAPRLPVTPKGFNGQNGQTPGPAPRGRPPSRLSGQKLRTTNLSDSIGTGLRNPHSPSSSESGW
ncbi:hypothetical protein BKA65DRAFT_472127 [Rhexocercosporidium sp. MPI-PUGE-AT-0058]|nr:hypothetical protein BKA65DRAFT_472127 [Rhexocercosporidium sp. MPI-PUGE-AT-0058]